MPTETRLLIETAIELRRTAKELVRQAKAKARELNRSYQLARQLNGMPTTEKAEKGLLSSR